MREPIAALNAKTADPAAFRQRARKKRIRPFWAGLAIFSNDRKVAITIITN
jgi:hypothetical protein